MDLVESGRLLKDAVIDGVLTLLIGGRPDHPILEAVAVLSVEGQVDRQMAACPPDLLESVHDLIPLFLGDHKEGVSLHLFAELILFIMKLLPEILIIKQSLKTLFTHICKNQHSAGKILREFPDLLHSSLPLLLRHMKECDLKVLPALTDCHTAAKIDGFILLLGHEVDLVCDRRNVCGTR